MNETQETIDVVRLCLDLESSALVEADAQVFEGGEQRVIQTLRNLGYFSVRVDESPITDKEALLRALSRVCGFPDYFGFNWDALADSLVDFSWKPANGYILMYKKPEDLPVSDLSTFLEIVREAGAKWARSGIVFKLLVPRGSIDARWMVKWV